MADYEAFFREADQDGDGHLSCDELAQMMKKKGYNYSENEIKKMFRSVDTSGDNLVSLDEFLVAMGAQMPVCHQKASMRAMFREFDLDGNGRIDKAELGAVFKELGRNMSNEELTRIIQLADKDKSGDLDYEEFIEQVFGQ